MGSDIKVYVSKKEKNRIDSIFNEFSKHNPNPKTELHYTNNFTLLIAVILSAQSTDKQVNKVTKNWFEICDTPQMIVDYGLDKILIRISSIGLYNNKAKNIFATSKTLVDKFNSNVPEKLKEIMLLPGVGMKTAKVVLNNISSDKAYIAVDTHVFRISERLNLTLNKASQLKKKMTESDVSILLEKIIPKKWQKNAHNWLVLHGRYICKAKNPLCDQCVVKDFCSSTSKKLNLS